MSDPFDYSSFLRSACSKAWKKTGVSRRAGVTTPLFSIYSSKSIGIGEAPDLKALVDWCGETGISLIQLLPLNDVGFDFRPYDSQSSLALDPMYLSLESLKGCDISAAGAGIAALRKNFPPGRKRVDYGIKKAKLDILAKIFRQFTIPHAEKAFKAFIKKHDAWLHDYAVFKTIKSRHNFSGWTDWPDELRGKDPAAVEKFADQYAEEILFHKWLQWQLFEQFSDARAYASKNGVILMGDMPFLVSRDSADVWARQDYFKLDLLSGAPPDLYFAQGQRWGMPPYHWEKIAADGYDYLIRKMRYLENFFDAYRLDHFVGIFRLWTIASQEPPENAGRVGRFDPPEEHLWKEHGKRILDVMVAKTSMLPCAEDLGVVPKCSYEVLEEYKIPGSDIQRWTRNWGKDYHYKSAGDYRPNAMAMLSTHDTSALCAWWESEAGTVDEWFFRKTCAEAGVDFETVKERLFDLRDSVHGRLRWRAEIKSAGMFLEIVRRTKDEAWHLADAFMSSYNERQLYWNYIGMHGQPSRKASPEFVKKALESVNASCAVFSLQILQDWLALGEYPDRESWGYRINVPGSMGPENWSLVAPYSLERMMKHPVNKKIREIVLNTNRMVRK